MYITAKQVKDYLDIESTASDALLNLIIAAAQDWINTETGRVFEIPADTTRYFDALVDGRTLLFDEDLAATPTTVTNGDGTVLASTQYVLEPRNIWPKYGISLRSDSSLSWTYSTYWEGAISIVGRWGWSVTPPGKIVQAMLRLVSWRYKQKDSQIMDVTATPELGQITIPQGVPKDVYRDIAQFMRH